MTPLDRRLSLGFPCLGMWKPWEPFVCSFDRIVLLACHPADEEWTVGGILMIMGDHPWHAIACAGIVPADIVGNSSDRSTCTCVSSRLRAAHLVDADGQL